MNEFIKDDFDEDGALFKQSDIIQKVLLEMFERGTDDIEVMDYD